MTKTEKAKFNLMQKRIEELEKSLKNTEEQKNMNWRQYQEAQREIDSVHAALNVLPGIGSKKVKLDTYRDVELLITARLFAWVSAMSFGGRVQSTLNREDQE